MTADPQPAQEPPVLADDIEDDARRKERPGATSTPASDPRIPQVDDPTSGEARERGGPAPAVSPEQGPDDEP